MQVVAAVKGGCQLLGIPGLATAAAKSITPSNAPLVRIQPLTASRLASPAGVQ